MPDPDEHTIAAAAQALAAGTTTAAALVDAALARIADPAGEGARAFVAVHADAARAMAAAMDTLRRVGRAPSRYAGIPIAVKDLFDEAGHTTRAGSVALDDAVPAALDAPVVARLQRAGLVVLGRTNMSEFAFTGLGVNPHHGTPRAPWDRATGRVPGGSSSGAGVAAADGMGFGGLGTDTGGSCRIPAALCGVVGFKPTARRVPIVGVLPLSPSLDSIGPVAPSVGCCAVLDAIIADDPTPVPTLDLRGLSFGLPRGSFLTDGIDPDVGRAFDRALARLTDAGAKIVPFDFAELGELPGLNSKGGFAAAEAWEWHRSRIARVGDRYDPRVRARIEAGGKILAADHIALVNARARLVAAAATRTLAFDAVLCPTVPIVPPPLAAIEDADEYNRLNLLLLRNPAPFNLLDRCALSLPMHRAGEAPAGLMLVGQPMADRRLLGVAAAVEAVVSAESRPPA